MFARLKALPQGVAGAVALALGLGLWLGPAASLICIGVLLLTAAALDGR